MPSSSRFRVLPGGGEPSPTPSVQRHNRLRLVDGPDESVAELERAVTAAVDNAHQMRLEIERRIARALATIDAPG